MAAMPVSILSTCGDKSGQKGKNIPLSFIHSGRSGHAGARAVGLPGCRDVGLVGCRDAGLRGSWDAGIAGCGARGGCRVRGVSGCRAAGSCGPAAGGLRAWRAAEARNPLVQSCS